MRTTLVLVAAAAALGTSFCALAESDQVHAIHHPDIADSASASKAVKSSNSRSPSAASAPTVPQMDAQMQAMHEMRDSWLTSGDAHGRLVVPS
jgi:hypothetical protein